MVDSVTEQLRKLSENRRQQKAVIDKLNRGWTRTELEDHIIDEIRLRFTGDKHIEITPRSLNKVETWVEDTTTNPVITDFQVFNADITVLDSDDETEAPVLIVEVLKMFNPESKDFSVFSADGK